MRRRELIVFITVLASRTGRAQQPAKIAKIGFLYPGPLVASTPRIASVLEGLRASGYTDQVEVISRVADGDASRLPVLAAELLRQDIDVVVAVSTAAVRSLQAAGLSTPVVAHDLETDPVASGLIQSYAKPGGSITGVFFDFPEIRTKWLELLQELIPGLARIGVLWDPVSGPAQRRAVESAADSLNIQ
jgi:putative tryptophan/tyrosine transport system substrate-binding protein